MLLQRNINAFCITLNINTLHTGCKKAEKPAARTARTTGDCQKFTAKVCIPSRYFAASPSSSK